LVPFLLDLKKFGSKSFLLHAVQEVQLELFGLEQVMVFEVLEHLWTQWHTGRVACVGLFFRWTNPRGIEGPFSL
jgi:hypothetical protein